jgi:hypothetical protein
MSSPNLSPTTENLSVHAFRITFEYAGTTLRLVSSERVEMIAPPGETERLEKGRAGSWIEIRDLDDRVIYQRVLHNPLQFEVEARDVETGKMRRLITDRPVGIVQELVPELPRAATLHIYATPPASNGAAREVASFRLADALKAGGAEQ